MREGLLGRSIGSRVRRREDPRLLTGTGCYVDDVVVPRMAHAAFVRSPHPHARVVSVDVSDARALPGVVDVLDGSDIARLTNPMIGMTAMSGLRDDWFWALALHKVRHVGDPVAVVIAESRAVAEDAAELVEIDYELLDPVTGPDQDPQLWEHVPDNIVYDATETYGDVDRSFAEADRVVRASFRGHRHANQPMETGGLVAEVGADGRLILHASHQNAHLLKWIIGITLARRPIGKAVRALWNARPRLSRLATGARAVLRDRPGLVAAQRSSLPATIALFARDPARLGWTVRTVLGALAEDPTDFPDVRIRDVGGAFGTKGHVLREHIAVTAAARQLGQSVKWVEDRNEHLVTGGQARDETLDIEAAVTRTGVILGLRARLTLDQGAYPAYPTGALMFARIIQVLLPGPYRIPAMEFHSRIVTSNKATYVAYRGPWAMECFARERLLDTIARDLGLSRAEVRRRNLLGPDELPTRMITGPRLDARMSARATLDKALEIADFSSWEQTQAEARAQGRRLGLGFATYVEPAPGPPNFLSFAIPGFGESSGPEPAIAVLEADGSITLHTQQVPHGQGHETTMAQIAADELGVPVESVTLRYGDSRIAPFGLIGTAGSRSAAMHGGANHLSCRALRKEILAVAADLLEADPADLAVVEGHVEVRGVPATRRSLADLAAHAKRIGVDQRTKAVGDEAIRVRRSWDGGEGGWSQATHVCWVEIDPDTGIVRIPRYVVVEDCGRLINPAIVEGQIRGGVAQGVGSVFYEHSVYDDDGQMAAGTFMDYLIPTASEIPNIEIHHLETPSDLPFNYRGVGEGGLIGAPAAIANAVEDALADLGVRISEQHLPPTRILELMKRIKPSSDSSMGVP